MPDFQNMSPGEILELQKKNCIFCKIIAKEIPSFEIYSDDKVMVLLDINPANEGHTIILPKMHYQILPQIPEDVMKYLFTIAKRTSKVLLKALAAEGTTIFVANGAIAGQKAPHFMIHVIPRKKNDMLFQMPKIAVDEKKLEEAKILLNMRLTGKKEQPQLQFQEPLAEEKSEGSEKEGGSKPSVNLDDISKLFE